MTKTHWSRMAENNAWANATLYAAIIPLGRAAFAAPRPGFFDSLSRTLNHLYEVDLYYVDALEEGGQGRAVYDRTDEGDPAALAALQAAVDQRLITVAASLDPDKTLATERQEGITVEIAGDLFLHLIQHQVHHRGQAHTQLHHAGAAPPQLDDFWLRHGRVPSAQEFWD